MHPLLHIIWPVTSLRTVMESTRGAESVRRCYDNIWLNTEDDLLDVFALQIEESS